MQNFSNFDPHEQHQIVSIQNENFLTSFPIALHHQFETLAEGSPNVLKKGGKTEADVYQKVGCLLKYMLLKTRSKKQCLAIVKNINFLNDTKNAARNKDVIKKIAKLKLVKNSIQKEEISNICLSLALEVILGEKSQ